ncbi:hypothetical protein V5O48_019159, partial [Marasmius crinis-equi]
MNIQTRVPPSRRENYAGETEWAEGGSVAGGVVYCLRVGCFEETGWAGGVEERKYLKTLEIPENARNDEYDKEGRD